MQTENKSQRRPVNLLFLAIAAMLSLLGQSLKAQAKLEAKFAQSAILASPGSSDSIGAFQEATAGLWYGDLNNARKKYAEESRDQWSVYLRDLDNNDNIAIDLWQMRVSINGTVKYVITKASDEGLPGPGPAATAPVTAVVTPAATTSATGRTVQSAAVANAGSTTVIGTFEKEPGGAWRSNFNNSIRKYQETGRDDWSVYLTGTGNNENVIINLWQKNVSVNGNPVYSITQSSTQGATTTMGGPTAIAPAITTPVTPAVTPVSNDKDISAFIQGLSYDPRLLLSVREAGSSEALPAAGVKNRSPKENGVIICTKKPKKLDETMQNISILKPTSGIIFPGALILADGRLAEGLPTPVTLKRSPVTLRLDLPGLAKKGTKTVNEPKNSNVQSAVNQLLEEWHQNPASAGYTNASAIRSYVKKAFSSEQLALSLGFRIEWADNFFSAAAKVNTSSENEVTVAFFQQVFYTVTMDPPETPSSVFDPSVSVSDVRNIMSNSAPPAYVRSVDYGRTIMVRMETSQKALSSQLEAALKFATAGGVQVSANTKDTINNILRNSTFSVYAVGGNSESAAPLSFIGSSDLSKLQEVINKDSKYRRDNPGVPIAYTVAFLKDNTTAAIKSTSDYVETECTEFNNGFIKLVHNGAYVGRFNVTWQEPNEQGVLVNKNFPSGEKTAGYSYTLKLPGDAVNINIKGEAATGLAWDPWGEAINRVERGPTNCTYTISGTTLNRSNQVTDCPNK
ncbi:MAG: thiol-activated cytolysin family protein [Bacteroidota bacterium]